MSISFHTITTVSMLVKMSQKHVAKVPYKSISYKTWENHTDVAGLDDNRARITSIYVCIGVDVTGFPRAVLAVKRL